MKLLPLDDPRWDDLATDGYPIAKIRDGLRALHEHGRIGVGASRAAGAFDFTAGTLHQGTFYSAAFAVVPHVVDFALRAPDDPEVWTWLGILVSARRGQDAPAYLDEAYRDALFRAERAAVASFLASPLRSQAAAYLALAAVALASHSAGRFLWHMPEEPGSKLALFATVICPACEGETELLVDGFAPLHAPDVSQPGPEVPPLGAAVTRTTDAWSPALAALTTDAASLPAGAVALARRVAELGVPESASEPAVLCLVAALLATRGHEERARAFMQLASSARCPDCSEESRFVDLIGG